MPQRYVIPSLNAQLIKPIETDANARCIVETIVSFARKLGIQTLRGPFDQSNDVRISLVMSHGSGSLAGILHSAPLAPTQASSWGGAFLVLKGGSVDDVLDLHADYPMHLADEGDEFQKTTNRTLEAYRRFGGKAGTVSANGWTRSSWIS